MLWGYTTIGQRSGSSDEESMVGVEAVHRTESTILPTTTLENDTEANSNSHLVQPSLQTTTNNDLIQTDDHDNNDDDDDDDDDDTMPTLDA